MRHLRTKLLIAMIAVVVVTVGVSGLFTRRVTHEEMKRLMVERPFAYFDAQRRALEDYYHAHHSWNGVAFQDRTILTTTAREVIATSRDLGKAKVRVTDDDVVTIHGNGVRLEARVPPQPIRDDGRTVAVAYFLPDRAPLEVGEITALDRRLVTTFTAATLAAFLLTLFLSRRITRPVESLTAAVDEMACGTFPSPVAVTGDDEIARLALSFNAMAAAVGTQQDLRRRMVSDVAHELRTPLTNLRCELEAVQDGLSNVNVASLHEEVLHLSRLVEDLQELAVAEAGGLQLKIAPVDLADLVLRSIETIRSEAARRHIEINVDSMPVTVDADETRIRQVLRNLLDNAIRHTNDGGAVRVKVRDASVAITNTGEPLAAGEVERVFERFYRVDESRDRASGGAGLGLAIVKRLVELHGGRVWAESTATTTTFTFTLRKV